MLNLDEIKRSLTGAARLFAHDPDGMRWFDVSVDGFFRSFRAFVLVVPFYVMAAFAEHRIMAERAGDDTSPGLGFILSRLLIGGLDWVGFAIVMAFLARLIGASPRYAGFIVAHNWASVLTTLLLSIPLLAYGLGWIGAQGALLIQLGLLVVWARYSFFVARTALGTTAAESAGVVALDLVLGLFIERTVSLLFGL